jgi:hypothetical protein
MYDGMDIDLHQFVDDDEYDDEHDDDDGIDQLKRG